MSEKGVSFASKNETREYTPAATAKGAGTSHAPSPVPCELTSASESRKRGRPADGPVDKAKKAVKKAEARWLEAEIVLSDAQLTFEAEPPTAKSTYNRDQKRIERKAEHARELELEKEAAIDAYVEARIGEHEEYVDDLVEARREVANLQEEKRVLQARLERSYENFEEMAANSKSLRESLMSLCRDTQHIMDREAVRRGCEHAGGERGVELWARGVL